MDNKITTKVIARAAILTAISIVLSRFLSIYLTETIKVGFSSIPLMLVGLMFGPLVGFMSGFAADIIGSLIYLGGQFHLGFTLTSILTALIPALIKKYLIKDDNKSTILIIISVSITFLISHLLLNSLWLTQLYGTPYTAMVVSRAPKVIIEAILNIIIMKIIYDRIIPNI
ncbi:MAG: folate family ECF transporter S component [Peptoniphilaceae bacterium]|nr:folate family ECF transporter S component [Peptoniphilaceae bacterium]MDY6018476.1 folate family ECF transporter S component [Anaerococcus sp.]